MKQLLILFTLFPISSYGGPLDSLTGTPKVIRLECIVTGGLTTDKNKTNYPKSKIFVTIEKGYIHSDGDPNYTFSFWVGESSDKKKITKELTDSNKYEFRETEREILDVESSITIDRVTGYLSYKEVLKTTWGRIERNVFGECKQLKNTKKF